MSDVLFKKVDYGADYLLAAIDSGKIGLPDIQRPFVWKDVKVKDLFDSMFKGYPIGYLLLWETPLNEAGTLIGTDVHGTDTPTTLIIDGQQRLTSLYAVMTGKKVLNSDFKERKIRIAFNPLTAEFEVASASHIKSTEWIGDISELYVKSESIRKITNKIIDDLKVHKDITSQDEDIIASNIEKLLSLKKYPFSALEINAETNEEDVADIFVRINGQGQRLNQADFILTLVSVFWEEGRRNIENFCKSSRTPSDGTPSSYNRFIKPDSVHILRAAMCYGFKRARLRYSYLLLRGRDFETRKYVPELRDKQFNIFKNKLEDVLNYQNWQNFMKCILSAGYRNEKMITSETTLVYSYALYLIGKYDYKVKENSLRTVTSKWFFMSQLTSRYVGSFESQMEEDLANLRSVDSSDKFIQYLNSAIDTELTNDFWAITLPNNLATSAARSPHWSAYIAALHLLESKVLFSNLSINNLTDPSSNAYKNSIERHHLFPKKYLESIGIKSDRDRNQNANYAFVEWKDNIEISALAPKQYLSEYISRYSEDELKDIYYYHALYYGWENDNYHNFLEKRRKLMADVIKAGFYKI